MEWNLRLEGARSKTGKLQSKVSKSDIILDGERVFGFTYVAVGSTSELLDATIRTDIFDRVAQRVLVLMRIRLHAPSSLHYSIRKRMFEI